MKKLLLFLLLPISLMGATRVDPLAVFTDGRVANYTNLFNANSNSIRYAVGMQSVATISSLVGSVNPLSVPDNGVVNVLGYSSAGDSGGGPFRRVLSSSGATNAGTFFVSTVNGTYAWERVLHGPVSVDMFGAIAGDATSDQSAITDAMTYVNSTGGGQVIFNQGVYLVSGLTMPEFVTLRGVAQQGQKNANEGSSIIKLTDGSDGAHVITVTNEAEIINLQIDGNKANTTGTSYGIYFNRPGTYIESVVDGVSVVNTRSAGIYVNGNEVTIRRTSVLESDGYGIYVNGPAWDTIIQTVLLGWNGSDGLYVGDTAAFLRIENVDSYYSRGNGMTFVNPSFVNFYRPQIDYSFKHGMEVVVTSSSGSQFDVYAPVIHDSNFLDDGRGRTNPAASGTYSELCFSGTAYPASLKFHNARIAPFATQVLKPLYMLCWSNTIPTVGYGVYFDNVQVETASGARTESGKSAADGWLTGYWSGLLASYYDGTNSFAIQRDTRSSSRWEGVSPANAPTSFGGSLSVTGNLSATGTLDVDGNTDLDGNLDVGGNIIADYVVTGGAVYSGREVTTTAQGIQIKADTGETFGLTSSGDFFQIKSESDSIPNIAFNGPADTISLQGGVTFSTNIVVLGSLGLGHASDTTLARSAAGAVTIEGNTIITSSTIRSGTGTPEGAVTAPVGTLFLRTDGGAGSTLYVKESGSGNTGWAAK